MKTEVCSSCGTEYCVKQYTFSELQDRIFAVVQGGNPTPESLVVTLVKEGFRASHIKQEATRMWDERRLRLTHEKCWVIG